LIRQYWLEKLKKYRRKSSPYPIAIRINCYSKLVSNNPFIIRGPGEYEIADCFIKGISTFHDNKNGSLRGKNTIYSIEMDGINLAHLGDLGHKLTDDQISSLNGIDILMLPVGGFYTIDYKTASEIVAQIEPSVVIPMHIRMKI